ncbi:oxygen-independent coproporphyrinogen III oxidase [Lujinxingia vulgaris]|uniref:Coproporphyrinogen-III oxidase n=1 Tax=Lujinxingia vulgaris TaxID=2600176 RepID=A0A5C6X5Y0_9DELT|nr:oxygen-independent coproporphyrinogen III oxidase [Lujinxingia vulgaris]TXD35686.1 oxygen-independent coproporphyrinogen III oxidase [Lujinxingia vulgaris]
MTEPILVDLPLIRKYDVPGPRYTSYPTAPHFRDDVPADEVHQAIRDNNARARPLSLYFHIPFCQTLCWYCGCTTVIGKDSSQTEPYLAALDEEMRRKSAWIHPERKVVQIHFGGGTPTYLTAAQIRWLGERIRTHFALADDAEVAVEVDPRRLTLEQVHALKDAGFNRASLGVQDNNPKVQKAINRIQPFEMTERVVRWLRDAGFSSINVDLIYGLPHQTTDSFDQTLSEVLSLNPDRFAIYTYAHVPWIKPAQKLLERHTLPGPEEKLAMQKRIIERLTSEGYHYIGMDHYARQDDELARAWQAGTLRRNFQGYSTLAGVDIYGFGMSSISQIGGLYLQNPKELPEYLERTRQDDFPIHRAYLLSEDDRIRRAWIMALMCQARVDFQTSSEELGVDVAEYFKTELQELAPMAVDGLVKLDAKGLTVTERGRLLLRNICMPFDAHLSTGARQYSRTI